MALEDLTPAVRLEKILDGEDIEPANRIEYFLTDIAKKIAVFNVEYVNVTGLDSTALSQNLTMINTPDIQAIAKCLLSGGIPVIRISPNAAGYSRDLYPMRYYYNVNTGNLSIIFNGIFPVMHNDHIQLSHYFLAYGNYGGVYKWSSLEYNNGSIPFTPIS